MPEDDGFLIAQMQRGDRGAMRAIYIRYKDVLLTAAQCLLRERSAAEDCLHDMFVAFAGGVRRFDPSRNLKGYLVTCISNQARDRMRLAGRQVPLSPVAADEQTDAPGPAGQLAAREEAQAVWAAVAQLPYEQREAVTLRIHADLTFRQIAQYQDVPVSTVQARYRYALEKLSGLLSGARP